jgi:von Willebrand factor type A domain
MRRGHLRAARAATAAVLLAALPLLGPPAAQAAPTPAPGAPATPAAGPRPIDFAVVVDESGSINAAEMADEKAAASLLGQGELSPQSKATVIGFGSATADGQSPVDEVCSPTQLDAAGRQAVSACVDKLHSRTTAEGDDTDLPAAIRQAVTRLSTSDPSRPRIVLLLTDGILDVRNSPSYGAVPERRNEVAQESLDNEVLPEAVRNKVQIWPLGFGAAQLDALTAIARGGYQGACVNLRSATPQAFKVATSAEARQRAQLAFAGARCARVSPGTSGRPPGELDVTIPPIATFGTIEVVKQDPAVRIRYVDPSGTTVDPATGTNGSTFELSGQDKAVEALRITDPIPGTWRIQLQAPAGHDGKVATSSAIWQGVLRSSIVLDPASPTAGERAVVQVKLLTRKGVELTNPVDLRGIEVGVKVTAGGKTGSVVPLADNGAAPDRTANDGLFSGYLDTPAAVGAASAVSTMTAEGVTGDQRPYPFRIEATPATVTASANLDDHSVHPGGTADGTIVVNNADSRPHTLALTLADLQPNQQLEIGPQTVQVPAGSHSPARFTLHFGSGAPIGASAGRIVVTDRTDGDRQLSSSFIDVTVTKSPAIWPWVLVAGVVLLGALVAAVVIRRKSWLRRVNPSGLTLRAYQEGRPGEPHRIGTVRVAAYGFVFSEDGRIDRRSGGARWLVRRGNPGTVQVRGPDGRSWRTHQLDEPIDVGRGIQLVVRDLPAGSDDGYGGYGSYGTASTDDDDYGYRPPRPSDDPRRPARPEPAGNARRSRSRIGFRRGSRTNGNAPESPDPMRQPTYGDETDYGYGSGRDDDSRYGRRSGRDDDSGSGRRDGRDDDSGYGRPSGRDGGPSRGRRPDHDEPAYSDDGDF